MKVIESHVGHPLDMAKWFNYFSFDVMGELAFGKSFGRLEAGQDGMYITVFHQLMSLIGMLYSVPWLMQIIEKIPTSAGQAFQDYSISLVEDRRKMKMERRDVFSYILESYEKEPVKTKAMTDTLYGDCDTIVVAGSDTTASSLAAIFYYLAKFPKHVKKLREELNTLPEGELRYQAQQLKNMSHLNAVINETLRLLPPIASGVQRFTPAEGLQIGDTWIPGFVNVQVPSYAMFRGMLSPHV